ncbi:MAG: 2-vinyl bacteriochlorophyllide hydratase [Hyphomicrobiales bacterium]|jgi:3-vinyl bacteriochlorophyllide hydratase
MTGQTGSSSARDQRASSDARASRSHGAAGRSNPNRKASSQLYTPEQRARRDTTPWTLVQGVLAPVQFLVFLVSLALVIRYLMSGEGFALATSSVVIKTLVLYTIMVTGAIWEKVVFGRYLFAPSFFWEDVFSMLVLALHTAYLIAVFFDLLGAQGQMLLALAAYVTYVINAAQFVWKLRQARLQSPASSPANPSLSVGATS